MIEVFDEYERADILTLKRSIEAVHKNSIPNHLEQGFKRHRDSWVYAGGFFASRYHHDAPKDVDFFILNRSGIAGTGTTGFEWIKSILTHDVWGTIKPAIVESEYRSKINPNILEVWYHQPTKYQFIFTSYTSREELVKSFDYAHCCVSYYKDNLYICRKTFNAIKHKKLVVNNPAAVRDYREKKFIGRGWTVEEKISDAA